MSANVVRQQIGDLGADGFDVAEWNQNSAPVGQQFLGVPVRRRNDRLSQSEAVGKRARRHLGFVEIGRHVDVAHRNEVEQRGLIDKLVEENDMVFDAEFLHARCQAVAIGLAFVSHEIGMRRAEDDIDRIRAGFDDFRHGIDHGLDAFARRQETERQNDLLAGKAEFGLGMMRFRETESPEFRAE